MLMTWPLPLAGLRLYRAAQTIVLASLLLVLTACPGKGDDTGVLEPVFPEAGSIQAPCCLTFEWLAEGPVQLTISTDPMWGTLLFDSVLSANTYTYPSALEPGSVTYWRIRQGGKETVTSFRIADILSDFEGPWLMDIDKRYWGAAQGTDTLYTDTIYLSSVEGTMRADYPAESLSRIFRYTPNQGLSPGKLLYVYGSGGGSTASSMTLDWEADSLYVGFRSGGLGGGTTWNMKGGR